MNLDTIKKIIEEMLAHMNMEAEVSVVDDEEVHLPFIVISAKDPNMLIGYKGETLMALSHIMKKIAEVGENDEGPEKLSFIIDVNGYQKKRIGEIKDKSRILVERARYYKSSVEMEPMSPYERMIVHSLFSADTQIKTASTGFGRDRHIVFEYVGE
jgi:spoIIIJ-associated protein